MDWRDVRAHGLDRGPAFYFTVLSYGHYLWQRGQAARAILCLDRAFGADLRGFGGEPMLAQWPLPYAALAWLLGHISPGVFLGNPRVHYQHLAERMNEPRREQRRWRAWACWAITRRVLPDLPGDPKCRGQEPGVKVIAARLALHGLPAEPESWRRALGESGPAAPKPLTR